MKIVYSDGVGLAAMVRAAEKIQEVIDEFGIALGVVGAAGEVDPFAIAVGDTRGGKILVTVEKNPKIIDIDKRDGEQPQPPAHPDDTLANGEPHFYDIGGMKSCRCHGPCCNLGDTCTCPSCENEHHDHGYR
jgi:hypothetical protein